MTSTGLRRVTVIGCGAAGTSIGLALTRAGVDVTLEDQDRDALDRACRAGAGRELTRAAPAADLVVIATGPDAVVDVLYTAQVRGLGRAYTDVAGTKGLICAEAEMRGCDLMGFVPGHPLAGEWWGAGPGGPRADLFDGRPWILCPYPTGRPEALEAAGALVTLCGGRRREMTPEEHDGAVTALAHVPRLVCSVLAARLTGLDGLADEALGLAGAGLRDAVRRAGGGRGGWGDVFAHDPEAVADGVDRIAGQLSEVARALRNLGGDGAAVLTGLLARADTGRAALNAAAPDGGPGAPAAGEPATGQAAVGQDAGPDGATQGLPAQPPSRRTHHGPLRSGRPAGPVPRIHRFAG